MLEDMPGPAQYQSSKSKTCRRCQKVCDKRGYKKHRDACKANKAADERWAALQAENESEWEEEERRKSRKRRRRGTITSADPLPRTHENEVRPPEDLPIVDEEHRSPVPGSSLPSLVPNSPLPQDNCSVTPPGTSNLSPPPPSLPSAPSTSTPLASNDAVPAEEATTPNIDDIRVEYHPDIRPRRPTIVYPFEQFSQQRPKADFAPSLEEPWRPFATRVDFEFAELVHESRMSQGAIERLLKLVRDVQTGEGELTFDSHSDVRRAWDHASHFYPMFSKTTLSVKYKKDPQEFEFHHRPLWDWIVSQVEDPKLASYFQWDAQRLSIWTGTEWMRFFEEPCTADMFWDVQADILKTDTEGKPLGLIIWADKNKLSTFGTQKGHPIVVRLSNIDATVRNGLGVGGGRIVGMVPMINETAAEKGKKPYIDWKNAVYHEAFKILLEQIASHSRTGYRMKCGDGNLRTLYPFIHIITADYEEQCYFALIRGLHGLSPCPICLVPEGDLSDLSKTYAERQEAHAQGLVQKVEGKGVKEKKIKQFGLRAVENAFWAVMRTSIYLAMSFDRLHAYLLGLFLHLLRILKAIIALMSRKAQTIVDDSLNSVPSWSNMTHFDSLTNTDFNDGGKWADLSKIIIPCCYSIFKTNSHGYQLLKTMRKYIECDTYVSLSVQTDETLKDYDATIQQFGTQLAAYSEGCADSDVDAKFDKDWDGIIKVHSHLHASRDIRLKGVMANMDTKTSEKLNGPLRKAYQMQTNFKNIEGQLARLEDCSMVICDIRANIDARDEYIKSQKAAEKQMKKQKVQRRITQFNHIYLGSPDQNGPVSVLALTETHRSDAAFTGFVTKLTTCIRDLVVRENEADRLATSERMATRDVHVEITDQVMEYHLLKVNYESKVSWREESDLLRCSDMFHGKTRHDSVIVEHSSRHIYCELIFTFTYEFGGATCALALVHPFDLSPQISLAQRRVDRELGLCRVKERPRRDSIIVPLRSIKRGALLVPDLSRKNERLVVDTLDGDTFLRCIHLFPDRNMAAHIRMQL
ncbi:hypothetical protein BC629DRAFT_1734435 [Irpex lacteus]|nr:hypothetical protein BC629DRAFT_1734435 [Irpex lacteus]